MFDVNVTDSTRHSLKVFINFLTSAIFRFFLKFIGNFLYSRYTQIVTFCDFMPNLRTNAVKNSAKPGNAPYCYDFLKNTADHRHFYWRQLGNFVGNWFGNYGENVLKTKVVKSFWKIFFKIFAIVTNTVSVFPFFQFQFSEKNLAVF